MKIMKFGGAVLKSRDGFLKMAEILSSEQDDHILVVISAFSKATRTLKKAASYAEKGELEIAGKILDSVIEEYKSYASELLNDDDNLKKLHEFFDINAKKINDYLRGISITGELTLRTLDAVLSFGEYFALHTICRFLKEQKFDVDCIDSTSLIVSDENYGKAVPLIDKTKYNIDKILKPALEKHKIVITQGFVAKSVSGEITTMGIESSNLTAALLAELTGIDNITIWTDVEGIRSADPQIIINTHSISHMSYDKAYRASVNGLKLIYPEMLEHAVRKNISLEYRSAFNPGGASTVIDMQKPEIPIPIVLITEISSMIRISPDTPEENKEAREFLDKLSVLSNNLLTYYVNPDAISIISYTDLKNINMPSNLRFDIHYDYSVITLIDMHKRSVIEALRDFAPLLPDHEPYSIDIGRANRISRLIVPSSIATAIAEIIHKNLVV